MKEYKTFFKKTYDEMGKLISDNIKPGSKVMDIICENGNLEDEMEARVKDCKVICVEDNPESHAVLKNLKYNNIDLEIIEQDPSLFLEETKINDVDVILSNGVLHGMHDGNKENFLDFLFSNLKKLLKKNGIIILGDYYYAADLSDEEVEKYREFQLSEIDHSHGRHTFFNRDLVLSKAKEHGFEAKYSNDFRVVDRINQRYFSMVLEKI